MNCETQNKIMIKVRCANHLCGKECVTNRCLARRCDTGDRCSVDLVVKLMCTPGSSRVSHRFPGSGYPFELDERKLVVTVLV